MRVVSFVSHRPLGLLAVTAALAAGATAWRAVHAPPAPAPLCVPQLAAPAPLQPRAQIVIPDGGPPPAQLPITERLQIADAIALSAAQPVDPTAAYGDGPVSFRWDGVEHTVSVPRGADVRTGHHYALAVLADCRTDGGVTRCVDYLATQITAPRARDRR